MAINKTQALFTYDRAGQVVRIPPQPIIEQRDPSMRDVAQLGQFWINTATDSVWCLTNLTDGVSTWTTSPASGIGNFTSVVVNPGNLTVSAGDIIVTLGDLSLAAGDASIAGNLTVDGTATLNGPINFSSAGLVQITSTLNGTPSLELLAAGGINEQIYLHSTLGNNVDAVKFEASAGGVETLAFTSMTLTATGGAGLDTNISNTNGSVNITAGENVADALVIRSSGAAAGLQLRCGGTMAIATDATTPTINVANIAPTVNRTTTISGGTVVTAAVTDTLNLGTGGATTNANSIKTVNLASGGVTLGQNILNIATGNRTSGTHTVNVSTGTGTKTVNCGNADALTTLNVAATTNINSSVNANTSINGGTSTGTVNIGNALAGDLSFLTAGDASFSVGVGGGGTCTIASDDIVLDGGGNVSMLPDTDTQASPTAASTINTSVFKATFTGFTTAAAASQSFTITNSAFLAGAGVFVTVSNSGSNDAQMTLQRVNTETPGTLIVTVKNNGAAALNGDVVITGWLID